MAAAAPRGPMTTRVRRQAMTTLATLWNPPVARLRADPVPWVEPSTGQAARAIRGATQAAAGLPRALAAARKTPAPRTRAAPAAHRVGPPRTTPEAMAARTRTAVRTRAA